MGKLTISMVIFIGHVSLPEGNGDSKNCINDVDFTKPTIGKQKWQMGFGFSLPIPTDLSLVHP